MSKPIYLVWVNPEMVRDVERAHLADLLVSYLDREDREPILAICSRAVFEEMLNRWGFMYGTDEIAPE